MAFFQQPARLQLFDKRHCPVDCDCETDSFAAGQLGGIDTHHHSIGCDQRVTAVAGVDGGVGLDEVFIVISAEMSIVRSRALTHPLVMVGPPGRLRACSIAITVSPTRSSEDEPMDIGMRPSAWTRTMARSLNGSPPINSTSKLRSSLSLTRIRSAPPPT